MIKGNAKELYKYFLARDSRKLRKLNDKYTDAVAIDFNQTDFLLAIVAYTLSKVVSKPRYADNPKAILSIEKLLEQLSTETDSRGILTILDQLVERLRLLDESDKRYVKDVIHKAHVKTGGTLYAKGFSLGMAAEKTGVDKQEILEYSGRSAVYDRVTDEISLEDRVKKVRRLFKN